MVTIILNGRVDWGGVFGSVCIGGQALTNVFNDYDGCLAKLHYFISSEPIDENTIEEKFLWSFYMGKTSVDNNYVSGTSWTGVYSQKDDFEVGGHDITMELGSQIGKYCLLKFEVQTDVRED